MDDGAPDLSVFQHASLPYVYLDARGEVSSRAGSPGDLDDEELEALAAPLLERLREGDTVQGKRRVVGGRAYQVDAWPAGEGGFLVTYREDTTSGLESLSEVEGEGARFEAAMRAAGVGIWEVDLRSGAVFWDDQLHRIYGLEPGTVRHVDDYPNDLIDADDRERTSRRMSQAMRDGGVYEVEFRHRWPDGTTRTQRAFGQVATDEHGRPEGAFGLALDVTEARRVEAQLLHSRKLESIGELAGGVAHDFNNLLTVIISSLDLIEYEVSSRDDELATIASEAREAALRGARLTDQLLTFARRAPVAAERFDLRARLEAFGPLTRRLVDENVTLSVELGEDERWVEFDPTSLEQVLLNLISNARDAIEGRGEVTVTLSGDEEAPHGVARPVVVLRVRDTGAGISEHARERVFEPFFTTKEVGKGTGLGLPSCYGIVTRAVGAIEVEETSPEGTTFAIWLPEVAPSGHATALEFVAPQQGLEGGDETLLVVEDDLLVRRVFVRALASLGYDVLEATDGVDALEVFEAHADAIELVVTDVMMPRMGGAEFAADLEQRAPEVPVVFVSGYSADELERHGLSRDDVHFVGKPFDLGRFASLVREALGAR